MKIRRHRVQITGAALTAFSLLLVSCSQADEDANASGTATTSAEATSSDTASDSAEDDATSWPRTVDSLVVNNGEVTGDTEEYRVDLRDFNRLLASYGCTH